MPAHSTHNDSAIADEDTSGGGGIGTKIKNLFRRGSSSAETHHKPAVPAQETSNTTTNPNETVSQATTAVEPDRVVDQNARGDLVAPPSHPNAELGWPGVINGQKLAVITVDLRSIDKNKVVLGGGKKNKGSWVVVNVTSQFGNLTQGMIEPLGKNHHDIPKSGTIHFEFDKDWIGAKGEAEILHYHITTAIPNIPQGETAAPTGERTSPQTQSFQLGHGNNVQSPNVATGQEVAPEQNVVR